MAIKVTQKVFDGIEAVRNSGLTNMLDKYTVQRLCLDLEYYEAVVWIEDHNKEYARAISEGFEIIKEEPSGIPEKV